MDINVIELQNYKKLKNIYKLFCVGCVIFLVGFLFLFFGRPYTFDRTNKDLFLPFGLLFMVPGSCVIIGASFLLHRQWKIANDFTRLNKPRDTHEDDENLLKPPSEIVSPRESLPGYSQIGLNPNEPL